MLSISKTQILKGQIKLFAKTSESERGVGDTSGKKSSPFGQPETETKNWKLVECSSPVEPIEIIQSKNYLRE